jgi:small multidrug resistance pump
MHAYILLFFAIITEVFATLLLKLSNGWEKLWLGFWAVVFYAISALFIGIVLKTMNVGIVYAIWSGVGIALVCVASVLFWQQKFDLYALVGLTLIIVGSLIITLKSNVVLH